MTVRSVLVVPTAPALRSRHILVAVPRETSFFLHDFPVVKFSSQPLPDERYVAEAHPNHTAEEKDNLVMAGRRFWCLTPRDIISWSKCGASDAVTVDLLLRKPFSSCLDVFHDDKPLLNCPPPGASGCAVAPPRSRAERSSPTQRLRFRPADEEARSGNGGSGNSGEGSLDEAGRPRFETNLRNNLREVYSSGTPDLDVDFSGIDLLNRQYGGSFTRP